MTNIWSVNACTKASVLSEELLYVQIHRTFLFFNSKKFKMMVFYNLQQLHLVYMLMNSFIIEKIGESSTLPRKLMTYKLYHLFFIVGNTFVIEGKSYCADNVFIDKRIFSRRMSITIPKLERPQLSKDLLIGSKTTINVLPRKVHRLNKVTKLSHLSLPSW